LEEKIAKAFGNVVRARRIERKITQEQLGLDAGIQRKYVSLLERGENAPSLATVLRVSRALDIEPGALVTQVVTKLCDSQESEPGTG
jgi:transcriptional regulator with XRE-family HTH domain